MTVLLEASTSCIYTLRPNGLLWAALPPWPKQERIGNISMAVLAGYEDVIYKI
jgi:hypothetical protein